MMTVDEMKIRKKELRYTCAMIAEKADLPLSTVQKIFSGATKQPRYETLIAVESALSGYVLLPEAPLNVSEEAFEYDAGTSALERYAADNSRWPKQGQYTLKDYYSIPDDIRVELIDGVIYDMGAPNKAHQLILGDLFIAFYECAKEHGDECTVFIAPTDVRLDSDDRTMVQPDILILCHRDDNKRYIEGAPEMVVEILSESTRSKDCLLKLNKYMNAGVREYWIVDPKTLKVIVYRFDMDVLPEQYTFDDKVPAGISDGKCEVDFIRIKEKVMPYL